MISSGRVKTYIKGAYYHIYNRGVNKQEIFYEEGDFERFIYRLEMHTSGADKSVRNHSNNVDLVAFCLMANHFHLLVQNESDRGIEKFIRSLCTSHSKYMNIRYGRVGHLFQDRYKAAVIQTDEQLLTTSRYIHLNPEDRLEPAEKYPYSSLKYYLSDRRQTWLHTKPILNYFSSNQQKAIKEYQKFLRQT